MYLAVMEDFCREAVEKVLLKLTDRIAETEGDEGKRMPLKAIERQRRNGGGHCSGQKDRKRSKKASLRNEKEKNAVCEFRAIAKLGCVVSEGTQRMLMVQYS